MPKASNQSDRNVLIISTVEVSAPGSVRARATSSQKGVSDRRSTALVPVVRESVAEVGLEAFKSNIAAVSDSLKEIFETALDSAFGDFQLDEVEVELGVSADGKVGFLGSSVGVRGESSLKLRFKRKTQKSK